MEDYIVIRYSLLAGSLPSEKISNLQFSEGFPADWAPLLCPKCPFLGRAVSPMSSSAQKTGRSSARLVA